MTRSVTALVEPSVLRWARESIGLTPLAAARKIGLSDEDRVDKWEAGTEAPTIAQLRDAARVYKRPLAVFFLSRPPQGFDAMRDFRRLPDAKARTWSPELHGEYRRALDQRDCVLEIAELGQEAISAAWRLAEPLPEDDEELAAAARAKLLAQAPLPLPGRGADEFTHLGFWVAALEQAGVLVLTSSGVSVDEMRGFSLHFGELPVIAVNGSDFARGRLFSLLHEYVHILLHTEGLCDMEAGSSTGDAADRRLEVRCNAVAAAILMPSSAVLELPEVASAPQSSEAWSDATLKTGAGIFGVSVEAFLRRLVTLGRATEAFYAQRRGQLLKRYGEALERRGQDGGGGNWYKTKVRDLGRGYVRWVIDAQRRSLIDTYTAASYLDAKVQQLPRLAQEASLKVPA